MTEVTVMFPPRAGISLAALAAHRRGGPEMRDTLAAAERMVGLRLDADTPALRACLDDGVIGQVLEMAVCVGLYRSLLARGVQPALATGHSMGVYTALAATGCLPLEPALELFAADLQRVRTAAGGLAAVIGLAVEHVEMLCTVWGEVWISCYNGARLCSVSGTPFGLALLETWVHQAGGRFRRYGGYGPWHCELARGLQQALQAAAERALERGPDIPILIPFPTPRTVRDRAALAVALAEHAASPVCWSELCGGLLGRADAVCVEVGPAGTLAKFLQGSDAAGRRPLRCDHFAVQEPART